MHAFLSEFDIAKNTNFFEQIKQYNLQFDVKNFKQLPLYEKVEEIIRCFRLTDSSDAYLQFFLDIVFEQQKKGTDIQQFLDFWERKKEQLSIVAPEAENAVQIMTIHKSKGLEFPVVIFPYNIDIYQQINPKSWISNLPVASFEGFDEFLVNATKKIKYAGESGAVIFNKQREELELDSFNLLYVALTRPIEQLYVVTEKTMNTKGEVNSNVTSGIFINYLKNMGVWSDDKMNYTFGTSTKVGKNESQKSKTTNQKLFISNSLQQHNVNLVASSSKLWETEQGKAIDYGNLIHEMFSKIYTDTDVENVVNLYLNKGELNLVGSKKIEEIIYKIVQHPLLSEYYSKNVFIYNERELCTEDGQIIIPDRLVYLTSTEVVLIDYKTGKSSVKYHQQLEYYQEVLESMNLKVVKKLLIYINDEIKIEEI